MSRAAKKYVKAEPEVLRCTDCEDSFNNKRRLVIILLCARALVNRYHTPYMSLVWYLVHTVCLVVFEVCSALIVKNYSRFVMSRVM